jgi:hypothetical protein
LYRLDKRNEDEGDDSFIVTTSKELANTALDQDIMQPERTTVKKENNSTIIIFFASSFLKEIM